MRVKTIALILLLAAIIGLTLSGCTATGEAKGGKAKPPTPTFQCNDGVDNDGDGLIDLDGVWEGKGKKRVQIVGPDPDCTSEDDDSEAPDAYCGDGNIDSGEQCDNGAINGNQCQPAYNSTCEWCTTECSIQTETGEYCGDATCNENEDCSSCSSDCGTCAPVCGDATCNGNETCSTCESDCGVCPPTEYCGDATCNLNETCETCASDCGECVTPDSCSETDGGAVIEISGFNWGVLDGQGYNATDMCFGNMTLVEYYCNFNKLYSYNLSCSSMNGTYTHCQAGACA